ncbi:S-layer homology domain-containing protein [Paenibacillus sp. YIM B09110]|uniref:S-layer homology domain-containing protein n=1 Tax=Paenibacillus sp. YIM B09110 TaxID=3126102 RepID=UPI00301C3F65
MLRGRNKVASIALVLCLFIGMFPNTMIANAESSSSKDFLSFSVEGNPGVIDDVNATIEVIVPYRSAVNNMLETFTVSEGASVLNHTSNVTRSSYENEVELTVVAEDNTTKVYKVTVTIGPSNLKSITLFNLLDPATTGFIDDEAYAIFLYVPQGTNIKALKPTFETDDSGAQILVDEVVQTSGSTAQDFSEPVIYTVKALDGSTRNYTVTVNFQTEPSTAKEITFFGLASLSSIGIIVETNHTITITVPNGTDRTALVPTFITTGTRVIIMNEYQQEVQQVSGEGVVNFSLSVDSPVDYVVYDEAGDTQTYRVTVREADSSASSTKEMQTFSLGGIAGIVDEDAHTISVVLPSGASRQNRIASFTTNGEFVYIGNTLQQSEVTANEFTSPQTYTVVAANGLTQNYVVTVSLENELDSYNLIYPIEAVGVIDPDDHTITFDIPYGTDLSVTKAEFVTTGDHLEINGVEQISGVTETDLSLSPVIHAVDSDYSSIPYTVILNIGLNPAKELTSFKITNPERNGVVNQVNHTIMITVPYGTNVTQIAPTFTSTGSTVKVGIENQVSGVTTQNFTNPVTYSVYAADGTIQDYVVTVIVAPRSSSDNNPSVPTEPNTPTPTFKSVVNQEKLLAYLKGKVEQAPMNPINGVFSDVNQHWSKENIDLFVKLGFVTGYEDDTFRPNAPITRAEFAAMIVRVFNLDALSSPQSFTDVKEGYWASQAIEALAANGIIVGYADGTFRPGEEISRAEIIAIISRIVDFNAIEKHQAVAFNDIESSWNANEIRAAAAAGIIEGRAAGSFAPEEQSTRAEALSIILRVLNLNPDIKSLLDQLQS